MSEIDFDKLMQIAAAWTAEDPITKFVRTLPDELRKYAEETIRLRQEFISNAQRMLSCSNPGEASEYAEWIKTHVVEVGVRWAVLVTNCNKWAERQCEPISFMVRK